MVAIFVITFLRCISVENHSSVDWKSANIFFIVFEENRFYFFKRQKGFHWSCFLKTKCFYNSWLKYYCQNTLTSINSFRHECVSSTLYAFGKIPNSLYLSNVSCNRLFLVVAKMNFNFTLNRLMKDQLFLDIILKDLKVQFSIKGWAVFIKFHGA